MQHRLRGSVVGILTFSVVAAIKFFALVKLTTFIKAHTTTEATAAALWGPGSESMAEVVVTSTKTRSRWKGNR